ncbi:hypothetical protein HNQ60_001825 [Povalibacter uvarum]|uniref:Lipase modulator n=1 Tax=Povalibacter uvarum TaxID=732238 RepID=A0A841HIV4_9GAMM|nr:hypothetical protein [Povalibacter uvarum]MBB6092947.1 hypothetical protein [Povalibacter uvarum]
MSKALLTIGFLAVGCATAAVHFHGKMSDAQTRVQELETRIAELERTAGKPRPAPFDATASVPAAEDAPVAPPPPVASAPSLVEAKPTAADPERRQAREMFMREQKMLLNDPEYREAMRTRHRMSLNQNYPDLAADLGLTQEQTDEFMDLLADQQLRATSGLDLADVDGSDPGRRELLQAKLEERRRMDQAERLQVLGADGMQRWEDYQKTMGARLRVSQLDTAFQSAGMPLSDDQRSQLRTALSERERQRDVRGSMFASNERPTSEQMTQMREQQLERTEQEFARSRAAVSHILSTEQMQIYQRMHESELTLQRAQLRLQRANAQSMQREGS